MMNHKIDDILPLIRGAYKIMGEPREKSFACIRPTLEAEAQSLVFIDRNRKDKQHLAEQTRAQVIICDKSLEVKEEWLSTKCFIAVDNPKLLFLRIGNSLFTEKRAFGIDSTAYVHPEAQVHEKTYIGPFSYVGRCNIDKNTIIEGHCYLYDNVELGKNVVLQAGAVLGSDGFGHLRNEDGGLEPFPHTAGVIVEDDVQIGANSCIDRGALTNTVIHSGSKLNNLVHIAHNVVVGHHTLISVCVNINGSAAIGDYVYIGSGSSIRDGIKIGDKALIGMGSVVVKDVPGGVVVMGVPARPRPEVTEFK